MRCRSEYPMETAPKNNSCSAQRGSCAPLGQGDRRRAGPLGYPETLLGGYYIGAMGGDTDWFGDVGDAF